MLAVRRGVLTVPRISATTAALSLEQTRLELVHAVSAVKDCGCGPAPWGHEQGGLLQCGYLLLLLVEPLSWKSLST